MAVKAQLSVQLFADAVLVAESQDQDLWRSVFAAIQSGTTTLAVLTDARSSTLATADASAPDSVVSFANELGLSVDEVAGACGPSAEAPFVHLDQRYWEALRQKTGSRGIDAIAPVALAATLLAIWFKHSKQAANPTLQQCQEVLSTIGLRDQNAARSLRNADWLQSRNGSVQVNPARWSQAVRIAKAYCLKKSPKELQAVQD